MLKTTSSFRTEVKRQLRYAIAAAVGFMIVYSWRESIVNLSKDWVQRLMETSSSFSIEISGSLAITLVGVIIILISSKILKD